MSEHSESAAEKIMGNIMDTIADKLPKQKSDNIMNSIMDTISDKLPRQKSGHFDQKVNKMFGRQRSLHGVLGGGKSADVLLWRNKKISSSVLGLASAIWVFFEWLDYHFLTIISFVLVLGMVVQFVWSNFSSKLNGSSKVPRVEIPDELFVNIAVAIGAQVNKFLGFLQDVSCERNLKHFVLAIVGLWAASIAGGGSISSLSFTLDLSALTLSLCCMRSTRTKSTTSSTASSVCSEISTRNSTVAS